MSTMTISPLLPSKKHAGGKSPSSSVVISSSSPPLGNSGATVFVRDSSTTVHRSSGRINPEGQPTKSSHVVKISINPERKQGKVVSSVRVNLTQDNNSAVVLSEQNNTSNNSASSDNSCIRISVLTGPSKSEQDGMIQRREQQDPRSCFYFQNQNLQMMSSGQCSPSDTLDSGTCSDLDGTPPPLPKKKSSSTVVLANGQHNRTGSLTSSGAEVDSDDNESNVSCDSLNNADLTKRLLQNPSYEEDMVVSFKELQLNERLNPETGTSHPESNSADDEFANFHNQEKNVWNYKGLLEFDSATTPTLDGPVIRECTYEERKQQKLERVSMLEPCEDRPSKYIYEDDRFYKFHLNECPNEQELKPDETKNEADECFAGFKILERDAIRSAKGTVRGVKNRVRAGIATFLQKPSVKDYRAKDAGKVVVYTTTMGIVRETYYACMKVKQILRTHLIKYEERDLYMSAEFQAELKDRIDCTTVEVPQLFIDGQLIGDANTVERLNESGKLRSMLKPYQTSMACSTCAICGGYRLFPCPVCNGSKKSVHRNDFTAEFIALKCMNCDEVGLVRCYNC